MTGSGMDEAAPAGGPLSDGSGVAFVRSGAGSGPDRTGEPVLPRAPRIETLRKRRDFLGAASARRQGTAGFLVQARRRDPDEADPELVRVGFTCSRKVGNAVTRNRARRRLRAVARAILPLRAQPGWDYVLVGRPGATVARDFADLERDLDEALVRIHSRAGGPR